VTSKSASFVPGESVFLCDSIGPPSCIAEWKDLQREVPDRGIVPNALIKSITVRATGCGCIWGQEFPCCRGQAHPVRRDEQRLTSSTPAAPGEEASALYPRHPAGNRGRGALVTAPPLAGLCYLPTLRARNAATPDKVLAEIAERVLHYDCLYSVDEQNDERTCHYMSQ
jgi:hypothetical protein